MERQKPIQRATQWARKGYRRNTALETDLTVSQDSVNAPNLTPVSDMQSKKPISILQEMLTRQGGCPIYELIRIEGSHHNPIFRYRVWYNDKEAIGAGKSKQEAKHSAAKALIHKLTGVSHTQNDSSMNNNNNIDDFHSTLNSNVFGNSIGWVHEFCAARCWPPPLFENVVNAERSPDSEFTIACVVLGFREVGHGKSKRIAKRSASQKMWKKINTNIVGKDEFIQQNPEEFTFDMSEINDIQSLRQIAQKNRIKVIYEHIKDKTVDGHFQCLLQLRTIPVVVCQGTGSTVHQAEANAAHNALEYLSIAGKVQRLGSYTI